MKIFYPAAYFYPENIAFSHLEKDLLQALTAAGHTIEVVCPVPTRGCSVEEKARYASIREEALYGGAVHVHRYWAPQEGRNPLIRAFRYFWCLLREYQLCKNTDADVMMTGSTPPLHLLLLKWIKQKRPDLKIIYNLQDIFPDSLVNTGLSRRGSVLWKIGRRMEDAGYRACDRIIVISEDFRRNLLEKGVPEEKIVVIPNWVDENKVVSVPRSENSLYDTYELDRSKFYIAYSGNIGHTQNMDLLLDVAKSLQDYPRIGFVVVGDGAARSHVEQRIQQEHIVNVALLPFQPYEKISEVFSLGNVGLLISKAGVGTNSVPSKTWGYLSAQRPLLASFDLDSELSRLIQQEELGVCAAPDDSEALRNAVLRLYAQDEQLAAVGVRCRNYILTHLTREIGTSRWLEVLEEKNYVKR